MGTWHFNCALTLVLVIVIFKYRALGINTSLFIHLHYLHTFFTFCFQRCQTNFFLYLALLSSNDIMTVTDSLSNVSNVKPSYGWCISDVISVSSSRLIASLTLSFPVWEGNPSQSTSLHYMNPYQMNAYAMALKAVGEIIQDYDSDKMFPALGFGAKLPPDGRVSHEFPLVSKSLGSFELKCGYFSLYRECKIIYQLRSSTWNLDESILTRMLVHLWFSSFKTALIFL